MTKKTFFERIGTPSKGLLSMFTMVILLVAFMSVPNQDKVKIAESFFGSVVEVDEHRLMEAITENAENISEVILDLGLGGSPYQTEKPYTYQVGIVSSGGTDYYYALNGSTGKLETSSTQAVVTLQYVLDATGNASGGKIYVGPGNYTVEKALEIKNYTEIEGVYGRTVFRLVDRISDTLAAPAIPADTFITVNNPGRWMVGQEIAIQDILGAPTSVMGIVSIVGAVLNLDGAVGNNFAIGDNVFSADNVMDHLSSVELDNITIRNIVIDGNLQNNPDYFGDWKHQCGIMLWTPVNLLIDRVIVKNCRRIGIEIFDFKNAVISNCLAQDNGWDGIDFARRSGISDEYGRGGIITQCVATGHGDVGFRTNWDNHDIIVTECLAYNNTGTLGDVNSQIGISIEGDFTMPDWGKSRTIVDNCIVWGQNTGIYVNTQGEVVISNSEIHNNTYGIWLNKGTYYENTRDILISGNLIHDNWINIDSEFSKVHIIGNIIHSDNRTETLETYANIRFQRVGPTMNLSDITIMDNEIRNAGNPGGAWRHQIDLIRVHNVRIENNRIHGPNGLLCYGIQFSGTTDDQNILIRNNDLRNNTLGAIRNFAPSGIKLVEGNWGYITENQGLATGLADGSNIAHGLAGTPNVVLLTLANMSYDGVKVLATWDIPNTDGTNISVDISWVNCTAVADGVITISWFAKYEP